MPERRLTSVPGPTGEFGVHEPFEPVGGKPSFLVFSVPLGHN